MEFPVAASGRAFPMVIVKVSNEWKETDCIDWWRQKAVSVSFRTQVQMNTYQRTNTDNSE